MPSHAIPLLPFPSPDFNSQRFNHQGREPASPSPNHPVIRSYHSQPSPPQRGPSALHPLSSPPQAPAVLEVVKAQSEPTMKTPSTLGGHSQGWAGQSCTSYEDVNAVCCPLRNSMTNGPQSYVFNCGWQGRATKTPRRAICTHSAF